jgi:hypothetical protein
MDKCKWQKRKYHLLHSLGGVDIYVRLLLNNIDTDSFENIVIHGTKDTVLFFG